MNLPLSISSLAGYLGLLLDLIGTIMISDKQGGLHWYNLTLYFAVNSVIFAISFKVLKDFRLVQIGLLAICLATLPLDISDGVFVSTIYMKKVVAQGGVIRATGLIVTAIVMFIQFLLISFLTSFEKSNLDPSTST